MVTEVLPFIIPIVLIITIGVVIIVTRAIEYREKVEMLKHGYVPKGYQPAQRNGAANLWRNYQVNNCTISLIRFGGASPQMLLFNDSSHLAIETEDADSEAE